MDGSLMKQPTRLELAAAPTMVAWMPLAVLCAAVLALLAKVMLRSRYGFELTDEGYYLLSLSRPWDSTTSTSQFGFVYHPMFVLAGGDLGVIRAANYGLTFALAWLLSALVLVRCLGVSARRPAIAMAFILAAASLLLTSFELPQSPSYNTLAFQALLLGLAAMVAIAGQTPRPLAWHTVLGVAGALEFAAKPTTAAVLGIAVLVYLAAAGRLRVRHLLLALGVAIACLAALALAIDGSVPQFVSRLRQGLVMGKSLLGNGQGGTVWRLDSISWSNGLQLTCAGVAVLVGLSCRLALAPARPARLLLDGATIAAGIAAILLCLDLWPLREGLERYAGVVTLAIAIGCALATVLAWSNVRLERWQWALALVLLLMPHAYAFGSGRPYWMNAQGAGLFWILAGVTLLAGVRGPAIAWRALLPVAGLTVLASSFFVFAAMEFPMRQPQPLRADDSRVTLGPEGDTLTVAADMAQYLRTLREAAARNGFRPGDPLIDFTGHSPGAVYALDGSAPGIPWLLGGYPGSTAFAAEGLGLADCRTLARSWLLTEPEGPDQVSLDALRRLGLDPDRDYRQVGVAATPKATYKVGERQHLLAPAGSLDNKIARCERARGPAAR